MYNRKGLLLWHSKLNDPLCKSFIQIWSSLTLDDLSPRPSSTDVFPSPPLLPSVALSLEAKLQMLHSYMTVTWLPLPCEVNIDPQTLLHCIDLTQTLHRHEHLYFCAGLSEYTHTLVSNSDFKTLKQIHGLMVSRISKFSVKCKKCFNFNVTYVRVKYKHW